MKLEYPGDADRRKTVEARFVHHGRCLSREGAVRYLMGGPDGPMGKFSDLHFRLGGYRGVLFPCSAFCLRDECESGDIRWNTRRIPPVAHIDRDRIIDMRAMKLIPDRYHPAGAALANIKLKRLAAAVPLHELYLVALLIGLAQEQWRHFRRARRRQVSGASPKVLYTFDDTKFIYLYLVNVSSALIGMFHDPAVAPTAPVSADPYHSHTLQALRYPP